MARWARWSCPARSPCRLRRRPPRRKPNRRPPPHRRPIPPHPIPRLARRPSKNSLARGPLHPA
ncbi:hypothetical protein ED208_04490 [Stagnimonas aquatica]|uniref:Uncharacterized protein n=1 Tax=Stagnimonas aquatica TaxID=2689987 RepID=A0A3N0VM06_9GAMM|nr:hypothetical protein ED208_04490 [Stagnimonas aquatica]